MQINLKKYLFSLIFLISTLSSYVLGDLFYSATSGPDYYRYSKYFQYFFGNVESTNLEQGLMYYFLNAYSLSIKNFNFGDYYFLENVSHSIQNTNFIIYIIFLTGAYRLLKIYRFKDQTTLLVLSTLNFFPPLMAVRLIYKPEILILALFIWCLVALSLFKETNNRKFLIYFVCIFTLLSTIKATGTVIVFFVLIYIYFDTIIKFDLKTISLLSIISVPILLVLTIENHNANNLYFFQHQTTSNYLFTADYSFIYNFNPILFFEQPLRHSQNDSLIGILLLETFDDYFTIYWNNDTSLFYQNRVSIIHPYLRQYLSLVMTILLYFFIFTKSKKFTKYTKLIRSPLIGIAIMVLICLFIQFDPSTGDMMKNYYYSHLLVVSFMFLAATIYRNLSFVKGFAIFGIFTILSLFIMGFPKYDSELFNSKINQNIQTSSYCKILTGITDLQTECIDTEEEFCELLFNGQEKVISKNGELTTSIFELSPNYSFTQNQSKPYSNFDECYQFHSDKNNNDNLSLNIKKFPIFNIIFFLFILVIKADMFFNNFQIKRNIKNYL